ncbi:MAG: hypothetical protein ANABAC_0728 [Anaerolineae bacterium]|nr:MAG: hypothetical protein ANABAC_0728 [Anaerolineae bacterium]
MTVLFEELGNFVSLFICLRQAGVRRDGNFTKGRGCSLIHRFIITRERHLRFDDLSASAKESHR